MAGSDDKYGVTYADVIDLFAGTISDKKRAALAKAVYDPDHPLSYLARQSSRDQPFQEQWPPESIPIELQQLLDAWDSEHDVKDRRAVPWIDAKIKWHSLGDTLAALAINLVDAIRQQVTLMPLPESAKQSQGAIQEQPTDEQLEDHILQGKPLIAAGVEHWLHMVCRDDAFVVRAGRDSANLYDQFSIEFRNENEVVLQLISHNGEIGISSPDFETIAGSCDTLVITSVD